MARFPTLYVIGMAAPVLLLVVNLGLGVGGILATAGLFIWIGIAVMFLATDEEVAA